jgi:hypothetical protein
LVSQREVAVTVMVAAVTAEVVMDMAVVVTVLEV